VNRQAGLLILGPTGSGKTPLGETLQRYGLRSRPCLHFDFGDNLREVVQRDRPDEVISREDLDFLRTVLQTGALLEDEHFPIAGRILRSFLTSHSPEDDTLVVLNGLPRHAGQAEAIESIVQVQRVVHLVCCSETALARIRSNVGGDRTHREDDDLASIQEKLDIFNERTAPLL